MGLPIGEIGNAGVVYSITSICSRLNPTACEPVYSVRPLAAIVGACFFAPDPWEGGSAAPPFSVLLMTPQLYDAMLRQLAIAMRGGTALLLCIVSYRRKDGLRRVFSSIARFDGIRAKI